MNSVVVCSAGTHQRDVGYHDSAARGRDRRSSLQFDAIIRGGAGIASDLNVAGNRRDGRSVS